MTPCHIKKTVLPTYEKSDEFFWVFKRPRGLVLSKNSIVFPLLRYLAVFTGLLFWYFGDLLEKDITGVPP